ncbi:MAG: PhnD/SsuA/transferrin family substrate-binding protein [Candidatus Omnitrophica bacterium]|nr:PhnD/SsuA/transferrin family substrate-binding protein [Candidatus Omnitrophota bacterium]
MILVEKLRIILIVFLLMFISARMLHASESRIIKIGVLAKRGYERCVKQWGPTANYLNDHIPEKRFEIVPLDFNDIVPAVKNKRIDFILANSSFYVELESLYDVRRLLTLKNLTAAGTSTVFGGVIFFKSDREDIKVLSDLEGKSFMAVSEDSLGGWHAALRELLLNNIDPYRDFKELRFGGTHDAVVYAVLNGDIDAGTVRTDTLERMSKEGKITLGDVRVFNHVHSVDRKEDLACHVGFLHSTRVYPEWPFAALSSVSDDLSDTVAKALLNMSADDPAAKAAQIAGWAIPLSYQPVHDCLRELRIGFYRDYGKISFQQLLIQYFWWILVIVFLVVFILVLTIGVFVSGLRAKEANKFSEHIFKVIPSAVFTVDTKRRILLWNKKAEEITGYKADEMIGKECTIFAQAPCNDKCGLYDSDVNKPILSRECTIIDKQGQKHTISKNADFLRDRKGKIIGGIESFVDVTERKQFEGEVKRRNEELERINKFMVNREMRMAELKDKIKKLEKEINIAKEQKKDSE